MKKLVLPKALTAVLAGGVLACSLAACGGGSSDDESSSAPAASSSQAAESSAGDVATSGAATASATESAAATESSSMASSSVETSAAADAAGGDAAVCKKAVNLMSTGGQELQNVGTDPKAALDKLQELSDEFQTYENQLTDAKNKVAVQKIRQYFSDVASAAKSGDNDKIMDIVQEASSSDGDLVTAGKQLGTCMVG